MAILVSRVTPSTIDLSDRKQEKQFVIEEQEGLHFYREEIKIDCVSVDSGEGTFSSKPGKITSETFPQKTSFGKLIKVTYTPDPKTMPGRYRMQVPFRTGRGKPEVCTVTAEFKVVDTTPCSITYGKDQANYVIDLSIPGSSKGFVPLQISGPRNQQVELVA